MPRRALAVLLAVAGLAAAAAVAAPATAAPKGAQAGACTSPTLTGASGLRAGDSYTVDGCGFEPGSLVPIEVTEGGGCCLAFNVYADESGRFSVTRSADASGYYRVRAASQHRKGGWVVVAEWSTMVS